MLFSTRYIMGNNHLREDVEMFGENNAKFTVLVQEYVFVSLWFWLTLLLGWIYAPAKKELIPMQYVAVVSVSTTHKLQHKAYSSVPYERGSQFLFFLETVVGGPEIFEPFLKAYILKVCILCALYFSFFLNIITLYSVSRFGS
jgi:hypothetical protein